MTETKPTVKMALPLKQYHAVKALERLHKQYPNQAHFGALDIREEVAATEDGKNTVSGGFRPQLKALVKKGWVTEWDGCQLSYRLAPAIREMLALCHVIGEDAPRQYTWRLAGNGRKYLCEEAGKEAPLVAVVVKFAKLWAAAPIVGGRHRDYGSRRFHTAESAMDSMKQRLPKGVHGMALTGE